MNIFKVIVWPISITAVLGVGVSFFAKAPFVVGVLFALIFFAGGALLNWTGEKPGGVHNPEIDAPHYPLFTLLISGGAFIVLIVLIYYFPEIKTYGFGQASSKL